jgi:hypothetical protein
MTLTTSASYLDLDTTLVSSVSCLQRIMTLTTSVSYLDPVTTPVSSASCPRRITIPTISAWCLDLITRGVEKNPEANIQRSGLGKGKVGAESALGSAPATSALLVSSTPCSSKELAPNHRLSGFRPRKSVSVSLTISFVYELCLGKRNSLTSCLLVSSYSNGGDDV